MACHTGLALILVTKRKYRQKASFSWALWLREGDSYVKSGFLQTCFPAEASGGLACLPHYECRGGGTGIRARFRAVCPQGLVGSNPTRGIHNGACVHIAKK